jgi:hypothetical protein
MKTYSILYAEDVPGYGTVEVTAENDEAGISQAKELDFGDIQLDPEWNNGACKRIVRRWSRRSSVDRRLRYRDSQRGRSEVLPLGLVFLNVSVRR